MTIDRLAIITFTFSIKYEETLLQGIALFFDFCGRYPLEKNFRKLSIFLLRIQRAWSQPLTLFRHFISRNENNAALFERSRNVNLCKSTLSVPLIKWNKVVYFKMTPTVFKQHRLVRLIVLQLLKM